VGGAKARGREQGGDKREGEIIKERGEAWGRESGEGRNHKLQCKNGDKREGRGEREREEEMGEEV
jgi:hypothetical protein